MKKLLFLTLSLVGFLNFGAYANEDSISTVAVPFFKELAAEIKANKEKAIEDSKKEKDDLIQFFRGIAEEIKGAKEQDLEKTLAEKKDLIEFFREFANAIKAV